VLDGLELADLASELLALVGVLDGGVQGPMGGADRLGGDAGSARREEVHQLVEPLVEFADDVLGGHADAVEHDLGEVRRADAELVVDPRRLEAVGVRRDEEGGDTAVWRVGVGLGLGHHERHRRRCRRRDGQDLAQRGPQGHHRVPRPHRP
jgi:hypothetical protein